ncbi:hypothetical protein HPP92_024437 [Vanilla planifolia]|uniref:SBP-type domain-containing protein n=1 Tax=Vanilla planifolia TaxID=51239 RepID=A0A835PNI2_VANPL|nr:hypothetical protein HPP92_024437 [Vanilla planifolia]
MEVIYTAGRNSEVQNTFIAEEAPFSTNKVIHSSLFFFAFSVCFCTPAITAKLFLLEKRLMERSKLIFFNTTAAQMLHLLQYYFVFSSSSHLLSSPWQGLIQSVYELRYGSGLVVTIGNGECSVDLKLGGLGDSEAVEKWKEERRASLAVSSSKRTRAPSRSNQSVDFKSDLSGCRVYHRRQKVCELHSKTPLLMVGGQEQRFCQQYSRKLRPPSGQWRRLPTSRVASSGRFDGSTHLKRLQGAFFALPVSMESSSPVASVRYSGLRSVGLFLESHFATS